MSENYADAETPQQGTTERQLLVKILMQLKANQSAGSTSQNGVGSPIGVKTPEYIGQVYIDTSTDNVWFSNGLGSSNWFEH
jgi:hypothetical protein